MLLLYFIILTPTQVCLGSIWPWIQAWIMCLTQPLQEKFSIIQVLNHPFFSHHQIKGSPVSRVYNCTGVRPCLYDAETLTNLKNNLVYTCSFPHCSSQDITMTHSWCWHHEPMSDIYAILISRRGTAGQFISLGSNWDSDTLTSVLHSKKSCWMPFSTRIDEQQLSSSSCGLRGAVCITIYDINCAPPTWPTAWISHVDLIKKQMVWKLLCIFSQANACLESTPQLGRWAHSDPKPLCGLQERA